MQRGRKQKRKIKQVQSGIALSGLGAEKTEATESFLTSRTARVLLAGAGFLADAYDLFVINLVLRLLKDEFPQYAASGNLHYLEGSVASAALVGSMIGQIVAGSLADVLGRKKIFIATAALIIIGSFGSACSIDTPLLTIYGQICCWRFFLGLGVGGEYPLAATVTSESSSAGKRGSLMSAVFAMQGVGSLVSGIVVIACLYLGLSTAFTWRFALAFGAVPPLLAFPYRMRMHETETFERVLKERAAMKLHNEMMQESEKNPISYMEDPSETSSLLQEPPTDHGTFQALTPAPTPVHGTVPAGQFVRMADGGVFYHEIPANTPRDNSYGYGQFHELRSRNNSSSSIVVPYPAHLPPTPPAASHQQPDSPRWAELKRAFVFYRWHLLGTALSWFLLDVDFYANGLFNHEVTAIILKPPTSTSEHTTALQDACNSIIISCIAIPGYLLSVVYLEKVGRKNVQMMGFSMMALLFFICGVAFDTLLGEHSSAYGRYGFLIIYSLTFLFSNFGPNTTTFVIPGEIYPTEVRATCHGLSAAAGKLGAATGAYFFPLLLGPDGALNPTPEGMKSAMYACSFVAVLGVLVTFFFTPIYDAAKLEDESYLELEFSFLRPSEDQMKTYDNKSTMAFSQSENEMMQIVVHSAHDYAMEEDSREAKLEA